MLVTIPHNIIGDALTAHTVLITTLDSLEDSTQRPTALKLVEQWYARGKKTTVAEQVIRAAQAKILGRPILAVSVKSDAKKSVDVRVFEAFAQAWTLWAAGEDPTSHLSPSKADDEYGGAIHLMALEPWGEAIRELHSGSAEEARRLFRRSMELGSQCGTETNNVVQWTYAASFFDHRGT